MGAYNVFIIDPFRELIPIVSVAERLKLMFDPIAKQASFDEASFFFPMYENVQPVLHEQLIYICPFGTSVVKKMPGAQNFQFDATLSQHQGVTFIGASETGSEVWSKFAGDVDQWACLIFHELMHNKLQLGGALHSKFKPCSLSCASMTITSGIAPTAAESKAMADNLRKPIKQWTDGQRMLWGAFHNKSGGDPQWDLPISG